jgi:hypothetical protein
MKYMIDEVIEDLADLLKADGIDGRTVHEWIDGSKQKKRTIDDSEARKFLGDRRAKGEEITLITIDYGSWKQVSVDGLPVVYVQEGSAIT